MSRARQVANFDPALFAADEVSGDKVHGGTISGSPTLVTPALGTPASGVATNLTSIPAANLTGTLSGDRFPAKTLVGYKQHIMSSSLSRYDSTAYLTIANFTYSPHGGASNNTNIIVIANISTENVTDTAEGRKKLNIEISGADITNLNEGNTEFMGNYNQSIRNYGGFAQVTNAVTLDGTGNADITFVFQVANSNAGASVGFGIRGGVHRTNFLVLEFTP